MPVIVILIVASLSFYVFYKIKSFRTKNVLEKRWIGTKSSIALGAFVCFFGINQLYLNYTTISIVIGSIFIIVGLFSIWTSYKAYKYYLPHIANLYRESQQN
ncbi:YtpI family protein [Bacillus kwashiorkori]|uniref:YtpI family protein n=1 Tax=Bacillus kwashiorkori TaxID=1522318 RepID=UPI0007811F81|nr:YtpI family protein [Bacillus kwashiorkori]